LCFYWRIICIQVIGLKITLSMVLVSQADIGLITVGYGGHGAPGNSGLKTDLFGDQKMGVSSGLRKGSFMAHTVIYRGLNRRRHT
jgi:hypothetical protein